MAIAVAFLAIFAVGAYIGTDEDRAEPERSTASQDTGPWGELIRREADDPFAMGDVDAPVVLIEYADFTCKYCGVFAHETLPALVEEYVASGDLRIEWRDAPVLSDDSVTTAIAARAAGQQDLFWEYYEGLYAKTYRGDHDYRREVLVDLAVQVDGMDVDAFTAALDDPVLAGAVAEEATTSRSLGVTSTPTFVLGDQAIQGAQPLEVFRKLIDERLAEAA